MPAKRVWAFALDEKITRQVKRFDKAALREIGKLKTTSST